MYIVCNWCDVMCAVWLFECPGLSQPKLQDIKFGWGSLLIMTSIKVRDTLHSQPFLFFTIWNWLKPILASQPRASLLDYLV